MIFFDISKSFDRVWYSGLLIKLQAYGIRGNLLNWIQDYLSERTQNVFVGNSYSSKAFLKAGVPQGSVLGPLLFIYFFYINDVADNLNSLVRMFTDDTSLTYSSSDTLEIEYILNSDLLTIKLWSDKWKVNFNPNKTDVILFKYNFTDIDLSLYLGKSLLLFSDFHKHLGIRLSSNFKWSEHIANISKSVSKQLSMLRKLKYILKRETLLKLKATCIRPPIWNIQPLLDPPYGIYMRSLG